MTPYDWLFVFAGAAVIALFTFARLVRALLGLVELWMAALLSGLLYQELAFRLQALTGRNPVLGRGLVFDILLLLFFAAGYVSTRVAFPVTKLPALGILDNLLGLLLGAMIAILLVALLVNSLGIMTSERWPTNPTGWGRLRAVYVTSRLRQLTAPILRVYGWSFVPFFRGLPPALAPQG